MDRRELLILMQNSMAHATKIAISNKKDKDIELEDVVVDALEIAVSVLDKVNNICKETGRKPGESR